MPKRSAEAMMKAISSTFSQQQPEKRTRQSSSSKATNSVAAIQRLTFKTRYMTRACRGIKYFPNEMLDEILNKLETHEQFKLRRVCQAWKNSIEKIFKLKRYLKINFIMNLKRKLPCHETIPKTSLQSLQFESNWIEPTLASYKKAEFTVQGRHFKDKNCGLIFAHHFSRVRYLVVNLNLNESRKVFDNFNRMIKNFKMMESFSLIRDSPLHDNHFIPKLFATLEIIAPFRRLELYVDQLWDHRFLDYLEKNKRYIMGMPTIKSLGYLDHFALSTWPHEIMKNDLRAILQNVGGLLSDERKKQNKRIELSSLCIPMNILSYESLKINFAELFGNNAELQNVKRLQLTKIHEWIGRVRPVLALCPKLQSLDLYTCDEIDTNPFVEMINQCKHLTEVKILDGYLGPFESGPCAPHIRKLTIGGKYLFLTFGGMLHELENRRELEQPDAELIIDPWEVRVSDEFVKMISLKFPSLNELTVLSNDDADISEYEQIIKSMIKNKLSDKFKKVNWGVWNVIDSDSDSDSDYTVL